MPCAAMKRREAREAPWCPVPPWTPGPLGACYQNTSCYQKKWPRNPSSLDLTLQTDCIGFPIPETFWGFFSNIGNKRDEIDESIEKHSCSRKILLPNLLPKLLPKLSLLPESVPAWSLWCAGAAMRPREASWSLERRRDVLCRHESSWCPVPTWRWGL